MFDLSTVGQLGATGLAMLAVVFALDLLRKKYRESDKGERRKMPMVVNCPNRIEGLDATLQEVAKQSGAQTKVLTACSVTLEHNRTAIDTLVRQHAPEGGRERWKIPERMEQLQEETRDLMRELVAAVKSNGRA